VTTIVVVVAVVVGKEVVGVVVVKEVAVVVVVEKAVAVVEERTETSERMVMEIQASQKDTLMVKLEV